jgi:hypothetical protein
MPGLAINAPPVFMVSIRAAKVTGDRVSKPEHDIMLRKADNDTAVKRLSLVQAGSNWPLSDGWCEHDVVILPISVETVVRSLGGNLFAASIAAVRMRKGKTTKVDCSSEILILTADRKWSAARLGQLRALEVWPEASGWRYHDAKALKLSQERIEAIIGKVLR